MIFWISVCAMLRKVESHPTEHCPLDHENSEAELNGDVPAEWEDDEKIQVGDEEFVPRFTERHQSIKIRPALRVEWRQSRSTVWESGSF